MLGKIKEIFWRCGLTDDICPFCGEKLKRHGWNPNEVYTCPDEECRFNRQSIKKR